jgi:hypothetical protein
MRQLDRLGWTVGQAYIAYGQRFGLRANSIEVFEKLVRALPPGVSESKHKVVETMISVLDGGEPKGPIRRFHAGYFNERRYVKSFDLNSVVERMSDEIHFMIASLARTRVFLHSGVVAFDGRIILIPGYSESGKSTTVSKRATTHWNWAFRSGRDLYPSVWFCTRNMNPTASGIRVGFRPVKRH